MKARQVLGYLGFLFLAGALLGPGRMTPGLFLLVVTVLAIRVFTAGETPFWQTMALNLLAILIFSMFYGARVGGWSDWPANPISLLVGFVALFAQLATPASLGARFRPATAVAAAAAAIFLVPISDTLFFRIVGDFELRLLAAALAPLLALLPVERLGHWLQAAYSVIEPLMLFAVVGLVGMPFVKDSHLAPYWVVWYLLGMLAAPASLAVLLRLRAAREFTFLTSA